MDKIKSIPDEWKELVNDDQKRSIEHIYGPLLIIAGAGSGKTKVLTSKIAHIIETKKAFPNQILAVTFTNKAAKEMQNRVLKIIGKNSLGLSWLGTFHSISVKFLRKHAKAVGLNYNFTILDDMSKCQQFLCFNATRYTETLTINVQKFKSMIKKASISQFILEIS